MAESSPSVFLCDLLGTLTHLLSALPLSRSTGEDSGSPRTKMPTCFLKPTECTAALSLFPEQVPRPDSLFPLLALLSQCRGHWSCSIRTVAPTIKYDRDITVYHLAVERAVLTLVPTTCRGDVLKKRTSTEGPCTRRTPPHCGNHCWRGDDYCSVPARSRED